MKLTKILTLLGYASIAVGVVYGTITFVLHFVSDYLGQPLDLLGEGIKVVSPRVICFTLLTGGICIADSMMLKHWAKKHSGDKNYAINIFLITLSVFLLAAIYLRFGIGKESGSITIVLWQFAVAILKLVLNLYNRKQSE